jgi:transposase
MVNTTVVLFTVQASRSRAAFKALVECWAGIVVSDGYGVYQHWVHSRQTCLAHLIRRARGLSQRYDPEISQFGQRVLAELQRLVPWAQAPPTAGAVQTWYARMVHLLGHYRLGSVIRPGEPRTGWNHALHHLRREDPQPPAYPVQ